MGLIWMYNNICVDEWLYIMWEVLVMDIYGKLIVIYV